MPLFTCTIVDYDAHPGVVHQDQPQVAWLPMRFTPLTKEALRKALNATTQVKRLKRPPKDAMPRALMAMVDLNIPGTKPVSLWEVVFHLTSEGELHHWDRHI